jgi:hypothetical protein
VVQAEGKEMMSTERVIDGLTVATLNVAIPVKKLKIELLNHLHGCYIRV